MQDAEAYRERVTKEAEGEGEKFVQIYEAYKTALDVTRRRMYLETLGDCHRRREQGHHRSRLRR